MHIKPDRPFIAFGSRVRSVHKNGWWEKLHRGIQERKQPGLSGKGQLRELVPRCLLTRMTTQRELLPTHRGPTGTSSSRIPRSSTPLPAQQVFCKDKGQTWESSRITWFVEKSSHHIAITQGAKSLSFISEWKFTLRWKYTRTTWKAFTITGTYTCIC